MDTLGDTCLALETYEASGLGKDCRDQYLRIYGFFQAVFLQQDSISQLYRTFLHSQLQININSAWQQLRDLRNLTVGHPIEKKNKRGIERCLISRAMIRNNGLQLIVWEQSRNRDSIENINLAHLYKECKSEAISYLNRISQSFNNQSK